jgi:biopolymer transport protein ExbD
MAIRDDLITQITTNIAAHSNVSISQELPFDQSGVPLYNKNMGTIYVDEQDIVVEQLYRTLDQGNVNQTTTTVNAYLSVDAKNEYSDINTVVANLLIARNVVTNVTESNSDYETEITDDVITYTFEYNFITV